MATRSDQLENLPSLPTVAVQVLRAFNNPDTAVLEIVDLIQADPALAAKVLDAANSARFRSQTSISNLHRAVLLLGKRIVCSIALSFSLAESSMKPGRYAEHFRQYWMQSFVRGTTAQWLASRMGVCSPEDAFTVGLLSLIGRLLLLKNSPESYTRCLDEAAERQIPVEDLEAEQLPITSVDLTLCMLERWSFPDRFLSAVRASCRSADAPDSDTPAQADAGLVRLLQISAAMGDFVTCPQRALALTRLHELVSETGSLGASTVDQLITEIHQELSESADLFDIDMERIGTPDDLLGEAFIQLTELSADEIATEKPGQLIEENSRLRQQINELTKELSIDPLTKVYNRRHFSARMSEAVNQGARKGQPVGILMGDIDRFKQINDTYGHQVGDDVLRKVAACLRAAVTPLDVVARYGGEEFIILTGMTTPRSLHGLAERIRSQVEQTTIESESGRVPVTISIGGALGFPEETQTDFAEQLIAEADKALYTAKSQGRNRAKVTVCALDDAPPRTDPAADRAGDCVTTP